MPGMGHGRGIFTGTYDGFGVLDSWLDDGKAPGTLLTIDGNAGSHRLRPMCVYPAVPKFTGDRRPGTIFIAPGRRRGGGRVFCLPFSRDALRGAYSRSGIYCLREGRRRAGLVVSASGVDHCDGIRSRRQG